MSTTTAGTATGPLTEQTATTLVTHPGCPGWCRGHYSHENGDSSWLNHHSRMEFTGEGLTVTVSLMFSANYNAAPVVMVMRHDEQASVYVTQEDAAKWATILDGAGGTDLATAIRSTLALVDGAES